MTAAARHRRLPLLLVLLLAACASTHTTTELAPPPATARPYARILVRVRSGTFRVGAAGAESAFAAVPISTATRVLPAEGLLAAAPPGDDSARRALLDASAIDGVLVVYLERLGPKPGAPPPEGRPNCWSGPPIRCFGTVPLSPEEEAERVGRLSFRAVLFDAKTQEPVWVGRTDIYRNGAPTEPYFPALAKEVVGSLLRAHLLLPAPSS